MDLNGLKKWMIDNDLNQYKIAPAVGVSQPYVSMTLAGKRKGKKIKKFLLDKGCPKKFLETVNER